ncbi:MAG: hypothetical protein M0042_16885 [Nitrospiraceae bacterium]|nr:hypothetical protein [Nitrospiraceae bacterium]
MYIRLLTAVLLAIAAPAYAADIKVAVAEVKDQRSTGEFFNSLEIKLRLIGDDAAAVRGIKTVVRSAADDTGRSLLSEDEKQAPFETIADGRGRKPEVTLKLKNPARKASVVKEISGDLLLFMPDKDPAATVVIKDFTKKAGKPLDDPALARAGIVLTVLTKKEYDALKKEEEAKAKEAAKKQGMTEAMMSAFEGLFSGFFQVGEHDLLFKISDPQENLVDMDVVDAAGAKINNRGSMKSNNLKVLNYPEAVPVDARLRLSLKTQQSVVTLPLRLTDVALP